MGELVWVANYRYFKTVFQQFSHMRLERWCRVSPDILLYIKLRATLITGPLVAEIEQFSPDHEKRRQNNGAYNLAKCQYMGNYLRLG